MTEYGRRLVVDLGFEEALGEASRAMLQEGLEVLGRTDVRDHFWRSLAHDFRHYVLIEAWSPELALDALRLDLDIGTVLPIRFAIYELADGETAIAAGEPALPLATDAEWRRRAPVLASLVDQETERVARVFAHLEHRTARQAAGLSLA